MKRLTGEDRQAREGMAAAAAAVRESYFASEANELGKEDRARKIDAYRSPIQISLHYLTSSRSVAASENANIGGGAGGTSGRDGNEKRNTET